MQPNEILNKVPPIRPDSSVAGLRELVKHIKPGSNIVEIGCYAGQSTEVFAAVAKNLWCVDPWSFKLFPSCPNMITMQDVENAFDVRMAPWKEMLRINGGKLAKFKETSEEAAQSFSNESVDGVYIDADHWYASVRKDVVMWLPKVKLGGFISGHDYNDDRWRPEVNRAIDELLGGPDLVFPDCSWLKFVTGGLYQKIAEVRLP